MAPLFVNKNSNIERDACGVLLRIGKQNRYFVNIFCKAAAKLAASWTKNDNKSNFRD